MCGGGIRVGLVYKVNMVYKVSKTKKVLLSWYGLWRKLPLNVIQLRI